MRPSHLAVLTHTLQVFAGYGCPGGSMCAHAATCLVPGTAIAWAAEGDEEYYTSMRTYEDDIHEDIAAVLGDCKVVERTLDDLNAGWAATTDINAYKADYTLRCWEPVAKPGGYNNISIKGYPSIILDDFSKKDYGSNRRTIINWIGMAHPLYQTDYIGPLGTSKMHMSHRCHNIRCVRPSHLVYEPMHTNHGRSACVGKHWCHHRPRCLAPGEYARGSGLPAR